MAGAIWSYKHQCHLRNISNKLLLLLLLLLILFFTITIITI